MVDTGTIVGIIVIVVILLGLATYIMICKHINRESNVRVKTSKREMRRKSRNLSRAFTHHHFAHFANVAPDKDPEIPEQDENDPTERKGPTTSSGQVSQGSNNTLTARGSAGNDDTGNDDILSKSGNDEVSTSGNEEMRPHNGRVVHFDAWSDAPKVASVPVAPPAPAQHDEPPHVKELEIEHFPPSLAETPNAPVYDNKSPKLPSIKLSSAHAQHSDLDENRGDDLR